MYFNHNRGSSGAVVVGVLGVQKTTVGEKIVGTANDKNPLGKFHSVLSGRGGVVGVLS